MRQVFCLNGGKYVGEFKECLRDGCGPHQFQNGDKYEG
jgi:hypothetical protein